MIIQLPPTEADDMLIKTEFDLRDHARKRHFEHFMQTVAVKSEEALLTYCTKRGVSHETWQWMKGELNND